jgi:hypothetical protein
MVVSTVITAIVVIILIIIVIRIIKRNSKLVNVMPANSEQVISASSLGKSTIGTTNNCTYSIWIYVNDWSVNYGDEKIIYQRSTTPTSEPELLVALGDYETNLIVRTQILSRHEPGYYMSNNYVCNTNPNANFSCGVTGSFNCEETCNEMTNCVGYQYDSKISTTTCNFVTLNEPNTIPNYQPTATNTDAIYAEKILRTHKTCIVPNIEIQKWINIILSSDTNGMDIYIDGELVQSCNLEGEINISNASNVYISPGGNGFNGWNSRFQFWPKYINPRQAMDIYRKGSGSTNLGALDYKLNVSLNSGTKVIASANI